MVLRKASGVARTGSRQPAIGDRQEHVTVPPGLGLVLEDLLADRPPQILEGRRR